MGGSSLLVHVLLYVTCVCDTVIHVRMLYVMRKVHVWIGTILRLSCAIYGSTICAIICGLCIQFMDCTVRKAWMDTSMDCSVQTIDPHGLYLRALCKYGLELRCMHNGGSTLCTWQQAMHRLYVLVYTKHGQASGMQRRVTILTCRLNTEVRSKLMLKYALYGY